MIPLCYSVQPVCGEINWTGVPVATINAPLWGTSYCPETRFQCAYIPQGDFYIRMACAEKDPRACHIAPDSAVWEDSCMECFLSFGGEAYMNLEVNSNGALLCGYGASRAGRQAVAEMDCPRPQVDTVQKGMGSWAVILHIREETIAALWNGTRLTQGGAAYGNFYKCGNKTPNPHFLSWNPIELTTKNFHVPEFFGELQFA